MLHIFHSLTWIVKADYSKCNTEDFLHCQYVLINKLSKGARAGKKAIMKMNDEATQMSFFFLLEPIEIQSHSGSAKAFPAAAAAAAGCEMCL